MNLFELLSDLMEKKIDPDWRLQKSLGDIEFEQDMYDDFVYGKGGRDEKALEGLRKHSASGPSRYSTGDFFNSPLFKKYVPWFFQPEGWYDTDNSSIGINLDSILKNKKAMEYLGDLPEGSLQDYISDLFRHEYGHVDNNESQEDQHEDIYRRGIMYGLSPATVEHYKRLIS